jgi:hypothetical protein
MEKNMTTNDTLFDKRIINRNIEKGLLSKDELKEYIESLPDSSDNAEEIDLDGKNEEETSEAEASASVENMQDNEFAPADAEGLSGLTDESSDL